MNIAIVILNWNGKPLLQKFLPSVVNYSENLADIYVVDNASEDDSVNFVKTHYPKIKLIEFEKNLGFALGYNCALEQIEADIYCLLNSDVEVTSNWLTPIIKSFKQQPNTAILQSKIRNFHNSQSFDYAGAAGGFIDKYGFPYCRGRIFNTIEKDKGQYDTIQDIFWASGACLFIRSKNFHEVQGFDPTFFAHMEEIDLCWRIKNLGNAIKVVPESVVYHVGGATLNVTHPKKTYLNFRNSLYTVVKNAPRPLFGIIFIRLLLDGLAGFKFLIELKPLHTFAVIRAHLVFYFNYIRLIRSRNHAPKTKNYFQTKSIVWQYFVNKKRTFNSL